MPNYPASGISQRQGGLRPGDLPGYGPGHWDALALSSFNLGEGGEVLKWLSRGIEYNHVMPMPGGQYTIRIADTGDGKPGVRFANTRDAGLISLNEFDPSSPFTVYAVATALGFDGGEEAFNSYGYIVNSVSASLGGDTWNLGLTSLSASNPEGRQAWSYIENITNPEGPFNWINQDVDFEANGRFALYSSFNTTDLGLTGSYKSTALEPYSSYFAAPTIMGPAKISIGANTTFEDIMIGGFVGDIHEVIVYQALHDAETQERLYREYLKPKWGISNTIL